jgi:hypothetical protein
MLKFYNYSINDVSGHHQGGERMQELHASHTIGFLASPHAMYLLV